MLQLKEEAEQNCLVSLLKAQTVSAFLLAAPNRIDHRDKYSVLYWFWVSKYLDYRSFWLLMEERWQLLTDDWTVPWVRPNPMSCPLFKLRQGATPMEAVALPPVGRELVVQCIEVIINRIN